MVALPRYPLVSFCVKCFNQKQYIAAALEGAFSQTYRPLEIVVSDDGSTDGSLEEIQRVVETNSTLHPDIKVILNHNEHNLGNLGNWTKAASLSSGELLVKADGDDISLPERTERVVAAWIAAGGRCGVVFHDAVKIDAAGVECGVTTREVFENRLPLGAVMACRRDCVVGPWLLEPSGGYDDLVTYGRSRILGYDEIRIPDKLVQYRVGVGVSTVGQSSYSSVMVRTSVLDRDSWRNLFTDLRASVHLIDPNRYEILLREYGDVMKRAEALGDLWNGESMKSRMRAFLQLHPKIHLSKECMIHFVLIFPHCAVFPLLDYLHRQSKR